MSEPHRISLQEIINLKILEDRGPKCYICFKPHLSYRCPHKHSGRRKCGLCMKWGHMKRKCPKIRCVKCELLGHIGRNCHPGIFAEYRRQVQCLSKYRFGSNLFWYFTHRLDWKWRRHSLEFRDEILEEEQQWFNLLGDRDPCVSTPEEENVLRDLKTTITK